MSKRHPVSSRFAPRGVSPHGLTAQTQQALDAMIAAARKAGVTVVVRSGYRSYSTQAGILQSKIREYGDEALARRYNAAPGRSEHQTGLAVDLYDGVTWGLAVRNTKTGRWLWANAPAYGFILRYPPGKEAITGYAYEPWHFRYLGVALSRAFAPNTSQTLEEYLRVR
ncbi:MAG: M15 family metallopeptidase [Micropruina sp.]|nr:M15 family metallopeptidase [Micropruina sp.]